MSTFHKLLFDMVHKVLVPRKENRTKANYFDLTIMELLVTKVQINFLKLILCHINRICVDDNSNHGLGYDFWFAHIFECFQVLVK